MSKFIKKYLEEFKKIEPTKTATPGPIGLTGAVGIAGVTGIIGTVGVTGLQGNPRILASPKATRPPGPVGIRGVQGVTGIGGTDHFERLVQRHAIELCIKKENPTTEDLKNTVETNIRESSKWYSPSKLEKARKELEQIISAIECPIEDVPLHINSTYTAAQIAARRLKDAE